MKLLRRFLSDPSGATAVEYGLILAVLSMVVIGAAGALGGGLNARFSALAGSIAAAGQ